MLTGIDIVKNERIQKLIQTNKDTFYKRVFTKDEINYIRDKRDSIGTIAGLFAAKEAVSKMLGTGIGEISWTDIEICHSGKGKPYLNINDKLKTIFRMLGIKEVDISISNEKEFSIAVAVAVSNKGLEVGIPNNMPYRLNKRKVDSHKGDFGKIGIVAGNIGMTGSLYLALYGALRSGSGLVYGLVNSQLLKIPSIAPTEAILRDLEDFTLKKMEINDFSSLLVGPGIGVGYKQLTYINYFAKEFNNTIVIDADGLNNIINDLDILSNRNGKTIITPHPGEMSRLIRKDIRYINDHREECAVSFSQERNVITVLKGHETIVTDGENVYKNFSGNPGMATAGSGDVLAGVITSLIGQGYDAYEACVMAVYAHGLAGDLAREKYGEYGMIARDIIEFLPKALEFIEDKTQWS
ncbi:MAG: NAD(P)H-hydrate dehydratase [Tissierellales bacterium]|nr:NAD(P)H-hydrate dehydratase [Tissierellales bacterium]